MDLTETGGNPSNGHTQIVKNDLSTDQDDLCLPKAFSTKASGSGAKGQLGEQIFFLCAYLSIYIYIIIYVNTCMDAYIWGL